MRAPEGAAIAWIAGNAMEGLDSGTGTIAISRIGRQPMVKHALRLARGDSMRRTVSLLLLLLPCCALPALAQTSASYHLQEHTLNAGGQPANGAVSTSASFHLKLDAIGDVVVGSGMASASFHADGGFVGDYPPPGEVHGLAFTTATSMIWNPEKSVGFYELYRDSLSSLLTGSTGSCFLSALAAESASDATVPALASGLFYLVTARNTLSEEGTKGYRSTGAERPNPLPCP